ncbi:MAG: hypothetical protein ACOX2S_02650 [bacterium]
MMTNFNTHKGTDYKGINVGWKLADEFNFDDVKSIEVKLYAGDKLLATNTAVLEKHAELYASGTREFSTPFFVEDISYNADSDAYWIFDQKKLEQSDKPTKAVLTITGKVGEARTFVADSLADAHAPWDSLFLEAISEDAAMMTNFNTHKGTDYKGINVGWKLADEFNFDDVKSIEVKLYAGDKLLATNTAVLEKHAELYASGTREFSTPFFVEDISYNADSDAYWIFDQKKLEQSDKPTKAVLTITGKVGEARTFVADSLADAHAPWDSLFLEAISEDAAMMTNFNTHKGTDYKGINVGWKLADEFNFDDVKSIEVKLYAGDKLLATNTAVLEKHAELYASGTREFSTPFFVEDISYNADSDAYWIFDQKKLEQSDKPTKAVLTITGKVGEARTFVADSLADAHAPWDSLFLEAISEDAAMMTNFNTHKGTDYKGINVGWKLADEFNFDDVKSIEVKLYAGDKLLATNTAVLEKHAELYASGTREFSTPFFVEDISYNADSDAYWIFDQKKLEQSDKPTKAVLTITGKVGEARTFVADSLADAHAPWDSLFLEAISEDAAMMTNFNTHKGTDYKGINVGWKLADEFNFDDVKSIEVKLYAGDKLLATNTAVLEKHAELYASGTREFSTPFFVEDISYNADSDAYWIFDQKKLEQSDKPTKAVLTITGKVGEARTFVADSLADAHAPWDSLFLEAISEDAAMMTNFNTHKGTDYKGINVGWKLADEFNFDDVKSIEVKLYAGDKLLATNTAVLEKHAELYASGTREFSTPFFVEDISYNADSDAYWIFDQKKLEQSDKPTKAVLTITGKVGEARTFVADSLADAHAPWDSLFLEAISEDAAMMTNFNTHKGTDYKGINVGWKLADEFNFDDVKSIEVKLYAGDKLLATNTAVLEKHAELYASGTREFSTPFFVEDISYNADSDAYWIFDQKKLEQSDKPTKAVLTITGKVGEARTFVADSLADAHAPWDSLFPEAISEEAATMTNFNTHKGDDYKGVNVGWKLADGFNFDDVKSIEVKLYADNELLATNTAVLEKHAALYAKGTREFSTPFAIETIQDDYWIFGEWEAAKSKKPTRVELIITGKIGDSQTFENTSLADVAGMEWDSLFLAELPENAATMTNFNTHKGDDYKGVNVGWKLADGFNFDDVKSIEVKLYADNELLATNTAVLGKHASLYAEGTREFSTPFAIETIQDDYWIFGEWEAAKSKKPTRVELIITGKIGDSQTFENTSLADVAGMEWDSLFLAELPKNAATMTNFNTHKGDDYKGVNVGWKLADGFNFDDVKSIEVKLYADNELLATNTAVLGKHASLYAEGTREFSTPFAIETIQDDYWIFGEWEAAKSKKPTRVELIITGKIGDSQTFENTSLADVAGMEWDSLFLAELPKNAATMTNFNTHKGDDYKGVNVGWKLADGFNFDDVKSIEVKLYADNELLATNTAVLGKHASLYAEGTREFSTPFAIETIQDDYWIFGEWEAAKSKKPTRVELIITGKIGDSQTFENTSLADVAGMEWDSLFLAELPENAATMTNFNTHKGDDYKGVNVGWKLADGFNFDDVKSIEVKLYADNELLATNTAVLGKHASLYAEGTREFSTPFAIETIQDDYWIFGEWEAAKSKKPTRVELIITGKIGDSQTFENTSLADVAGMEWDSLFLAELPENAATMTNFNTHKGDDYKGVNVGWKLADGFNFDDVKSIEVKLYADNELLATNTAVLGKHASLYAEGTREFSTPFAIETIQDDYWIFGEWEAAKSKKPTRVELIITGKIGDSQTFENTSLADVAGMEWDSLFLAELPENAATMTNFNTHKGDDYKGVNVGWKLADGFNFDDVKSIEVKLYADNELLATNTAVLGKHASLYAEGTREFSTPFAIETIQDDYWIFGEWEAAKSKKPTRVELIITGKIGDSQTFENTSLADVAGMEWDSLFLAELPKNAATMTNFNTHKGDDYKGVNVGWKLADGFNFDDVKSIEVKLYADNELLATNTAVLGKHASLYAEGTREFSTPFAIETIQDDYWIFGEWEAAKSKKPTRVELIITGKIGDSQTFENTSLADVAGMEWDSLFLAELPENAATMTNFNTHKGDDYKGVNVGWKLADGFNFDDVKSIEVKLYADNELLATNTAVLGKHASLYAEGTREFSTPFAIETIQDDYWIFGEWEAAKSKKPTRVELIITGKIGDSQTFENTSLADVAGMEWDSLFLAELPENAATMTNFNTHKGDDYKGVNVGWKLADGFNFDDVKSIEVKLYADNELLATNTAVLEKHASLYAEGTREFSTPFAIETIQDDYWIFGEWEAAKSKKPTRVELIITGKIGDPQTFENTSLADVAGMEWDSLFPAAISEEAATMTNFNTHKGTDYKGVNVGWTLADDFNFDDVASLEVKLYAGDDLLATNTAVLEKHAELFVEGTKEFSTPFSVENGNYGDDPYWTFGNPLTDKDQKPTKVELVITGKVGGAQIFENTSLADVAGMEWHSLFPEED